jgi:Divergent InlB B-repeat domain
VRRGALTLWLVAMAAAAFGATQIASAAGGVIPSVGFQATLVPTTIHNHQAVLLKSVRLSNAEGITIHVMCFRGRRECQRASEDQPVVTHAARGIVQLRRLNFLLQDGATFEIAALHPGQIGRFVSITVHIGRHGIHLSRTRGCLSSLQNVHPCSAGGSSPSNGSTPSGGSTTGDGSTTTGSGVGTTANSGGYVPPPTQNYTVAVTNQGSGSVTGSGISCPSTCKVSAPDGTVITLTAKPNPGSTFAGWGGHCSGAGSCSFVLAGDTSIAANFTPLPKLTVAEGGGGSGTVTGGAISCPSTCQAMAFKGSTVTLTATPDVGSAFVGWSGGGCSGTGTCTVTVNADTTVTATFAALPPHTVTVTEAGNGSGTVTSGKAKISCPGTCSGSVDAGSIIRLVATPAVGSTFAGWSGGGCSGTSYCEITVNADTAVTATFAIQTHTLTTAVTGAGKVAGGSINCPGTCAETANYGTKVTLTATAATGSLFAGWSGGCSGTGTCTVTLNADTTVTANFTPQKHALVVGIAGTGTGKVTGGSINCPVACSEAANYGTQVTLTAMAATGSTFIGWSGGGCSGTGTCTVTLNADTIVTASFSKP